MKFIEEARELKPYMVDIRRQLHQIPEIGTHLPRTVAMVSAELEKLGIPYEVKEDISCIFAYLGKREDGVPCILLRADMDGLAIREQSGEEFACTEDTMHACGHDMHAAALLGAARILKQHESELKGCVKLLFQSAEETFEGAQAAIEAGVLENPTPQAAYGSHVFSLQTLNHIYFGHIPMGAVYGFRITVHGVGGHGSLPEHCVDPINAAVQIYLALQSLIARECPATEEAVLTIGQLKAGEAANIIPSEAVLQGTMRTFNPEIKKKLVQRLHEIVPAVAAAYRCTTDIDVLSNVPSVICDETFSDFCIKTLQDKEIASDIHTDLHLMGSEDFAQISSHIPSCYFCIGAEPEDRSHALAQHHPAIRFHEEALVTAAAAHAQITFDWLEAQQ